MAVIRPLRTNWNFQLLWVGQALSALGSRVSSLAYPLLVLGMTGSPAAAGVIGFVGTLPYILFQLPAGAFVDRVDRRRVMIVCDVCRGLALASIPAALLLGWLTVVQVGIVAFVEGALFVVFRLGETAAIKALVHPSQLAPAMSQNEARIRAATLLGQPVGGALFQLGRGLPFLADALSYVASLVTLVFIRAPFQEAREPAEARHPLHEVREGLTWLLGERFILASLASAAWSNLLFQALILALIVLERDRGASPSVIGLVLAGFGAGGVLGSLSGAWLQRRLRPRVVVLGATWVWTLATAPLAFVANPVAVVLLLAAQAFVGAAWNVAVSTYYLALVPDRLIARVGSVGSLLSFGALPLGSLAGGLLLQAVGPVASVWTIGAGMGLLAVVSTLSRSIRTGARRLDQVVEREAG